MRSLFIIIFFALFITNAFSQENTISKKFSFTAGYGMAGSFFVRSYDEGQGPTSAAFYKKNFIGSNLSFGVGYNTGIRSEISLRYTRQQFARWVHYNNNYVVLNTAIRHINNMYDFIYSRKFKQKNNDWKYGIGIYYIRPQQQEIDVYPNAIVVEERNQKYNRLNELGAVGEISYEYQFQPRVLIGTRIQYYHNITAGYAESVTFYPYIKIVF